MLAKVRRILSFEMTIAEWIGTAAMLPVPYLLVGVIWSLIHTDQLSHSHGAARVVAFLGSVALWPVLAVTDVCLA